MKNPKMLRNKENKKNNEQTALEIQKQRSRKKPREKAPSSPFPPHFFCSFLSKCGFQERLSFSRNPSTLSLKIRLMEKKLKGLA